nr:hypothetical protein Iba_chr07cCG8780 [Ipomoea batatas]
MKLLASSFNGKMKSLSSFFNDNNLEFLQLRITMEDFFSLAGVQVSCLGCFQQSLPSSFTIFFPGAIQ